jgi:hypothetical protein
MPNQSWRHSRQWDYIPHARRHAGWLPGAWGLRPKQNGGRVGGLPRLFKHVRNSAYSAAFHIFNNIMRTYSSKCRPSWRTCRIGRAKRKDILLIISCVLTVLSAVCQVVTFWKEYVCRSRSDCIRLWLVYIATEECCVILRNRWLWRHDLLGM